MIPFYTGMRVTGAEFCGRREDLSGLREYMKSSARVYLVGERRIGKTSLIFEAFRKLKGFRLVYVDLMAVKTISDVVQCMATALVKSEKKNSRILEILKELAHLQPTMSIDPITNSPTISFAPGVNYKSETLAGVFSLLVSKKKTIVVFDEFQDIQQIADGDLVLAKLRGMIQHQESTSFIFCGSIRNNMEEIFSNHNSPFFNMAMRFYLGPLKRAEFCDFLQQKFLSGSRHLEDGLIEQIIDLCSDNPGAVQRFCTALWQSTSHGQKITGSDLSEAWERLFAMQSDQYGVIVQNLSVQQSQVLRAMARIGGKTNLSGKFISMTGIPLQGSVIRALQGLITKRVVTKEGTEYRISDPFLAGWLNL